jgi:hypothetical protein
MGVVGFVRVGLPMDRRVAWLGMALLTATPPIDCTDLMYMIEIELRDPSG